MGTSGPRTLPFLIAALLASVWIAGAQQAPDPRVADLVRVGRVRIALFPPQYTKDPATGELKGVWADVARAFAARVGVELVLVERPTPPKMVECLKAGACDVGFLGFDPARLLMSKDSRRRSSNSTTPISCRRVRRFAGPPRRTGPGFASRSCTLTVRP